MLCLNNINLLQNESFNIKDPPNGKKIYGIFLDGYQNTGRDDFRTTDYTSVTGNLVSKF